MPSVPLAATPKRTRRLTITVRLAVIVLIFVGIIGALAAIVALSLRLSTGARAYVGGEGLWSKAQKDAVYYLTRYGQSGQAEDYQHYLDAIVIPLGDRRARLAMEQGLYGDDAILQGFVEGGNAAVDVPELVLLFRYFRRIDHFATAIDIWREAERQLMELLDIADELHAGIESGRLPAARRQQLLERIAEINARVAPLERDFSIAIGRGARWMQQTLPVMLLAITALMLAGGLWVVWRISRELQQGILRLREGALRVSLGDLSHRIEIQSDDELGDLATVFNEMIVRRRLAEDALRETTEFRDKVMESATNAIIAFDLQGRFTLVNRQACAITGYAENELLGMNFAALIPPAELPTVRELFEQAASGAGGAINHEAQILRKDGRIITVTFSNAPLFKNGRVIGVAGTAEDITERKRAAAELAARAEELARSNTELEHFAYVASHDLQEPLRSVASFAQLLARRFGGRDADADEFVGYITAEVQRMRQLIEGLLTYSRIAREKERVEPADLDRLLDAALAHLKAAIDESGATIRRQPLPTLPVQAQQITQLFQNLVGNALKFRGEAPPQIEIGAEHQEGLWLLSVRDHGIGIDPLYADRIFVLFQRLHARENYPGSGIGLAICKKIVERHGGRIWVEPAYPGSVFKFTFPAKESLPPQAVPKS